MTIGSWLNYKSESRMGHSQPMTDKATTRDAGGEVMV